MYFVDMHTDEGTGDRHLIVIDTMNPERNRIERVSDDRFAQLLADILNVDIPMSEREKEIAA